MGLFDSVLQYPRTIVLAIAAAVVTALAAYTRDQSVRAVWWVLSPLTRRMPWNRRGADQRALSSRLSIVDLQLVDAGGRRARYRKTSVYNATRPVGMYREGVTASGEATDFRTARGRIVQTVREHGFYISKIDLGTRIEPGEQLVNVYEAKLRRSFQESTQEWTQQVSVKTAHLLIQVQFPAERPPLSCQTRIVDGTDEREAVEIAQIVDLFGQRSIVWPIPFPDTAYVYKLVWKW